MTTPLNRIQSKQIRITCAACAHQVVHEVANLLLVVDGETTTHTVRSRATCPKCLKVGDNIYRVE